MSTHSSESPSHSGHDHPTSPAEIHAQLRTYTKVFVALAILTVITWAVSLFHFGHPWDTVVALGIAILKAGLVALFFMHLLHEKKTIYQVLAFSVIFVLGLFLLTLLAWYDAIPQMF